MGTETLTVHCAVMPLKAVAVMSASPLDTPVTTPFSSTVATSGFSLFQVKSEGAKEPALEGTTVGRSCSVLSANTLAVSGSSKLWMATMTLTVQVPVTPEPSRAMPVSVTLPTLRPVSVQVPSQLFTPETQSLDKRQLKSLL